MLPKRQKGKLRNLQLPKLQKWTFRSWNVDIKTDAEHTRRLTAMNMNMSNNAANSFINSSKFCASSHPHRQCSVYHKRCIKCNRKGHFANCCHSRKSVTQIYSFIWLTRIKQNSSRAQLMPKIPSMNYTFPMNHLHPPLTHLSPLEKFNAGPKICTVDFKMDWRQDKCTFLNHIQ